MKITERPLGIFVIVIFVAGIGGTMAFNLWQTESRKVPAKIAEGPAAGQANPADIRGSYSFTDIETAFGVPVRDLARAFDVPQKDAATFKCKDLETLYGESNAAQGIEIGTGSVRLFVARYLSLPTAGLEDSALPEPALQLLAEMGK